MTLRAADHSMSFARCDWCNEQLTVGEERTPGRKCMDCRSSHNPHRLFVTVVSDGTDETIFVSTVGPELLFPEQPYPRDMPQRRGRILL